MSINDRGPAPFVVRLAPGAGHRSGLSGLGALAEPRLRSSRSPLRSPRRSVPASTGSRRPHAPGRSVSDRDREAERLAAVRRFDVLGAPRDGSFDRITALAARIFDMPISVVTIVDEDRILFKSLYGAVDAREIPREPGLCASAVWQDVPYVVEGARTDPRTRDNSLVTGPLGIQFYAAAPLRRA